MKAACLFAIGCLAFLFYACVTGDEITSYVVNPDESISFSIYRLNLTSDQTGEKAKEELAKYIQDMEEKRGDPFKGLERGKANGIDVKILRRTSPASVLITGRIPSLGDFASCFSEENEDSTVVCKAVSKEHTRSILCEVTRKPSKEKPQPENTAKAEPARPRADSFQEMRIALSKGTFTKAQGFLLAHNRRSALLDLDTLAKMWDSKAPKIAFSLEWQIE